MTQDQQTLLNTFIIKATFKNVSFPASRALGQGVRYTAQELLHLNITTLRKIGKDIETADKNHGGSKFEKNSQLEIEGFPATDIIDFLQLAIIRQEEAADVKKKSDAIKSIKAQLEEMKSPSERKDDLLKKLSELEGNPVFVGTPSGI